jgi:DNA recombination protein RmuC
MSWIDYAELIGIAVLVAIGLIIYFRKDDFDLRAIKELQVEIKEKIVQRDALDLESVEKANKSSEEEAKILREELKTLKELVEKERKERGEAYGSITENVGRLHQQYEGLADSASKLRSALSDSSMRGNWGEVQLRRVIEHSSMIKHVDFIEQETVETSDGSTQRPDVIVNMPSGKKLVIDSKAPGKLLQAYETNVESERDEIMKEFADDVWSTVKLLARKKYQDNIKDAAGKQISPDFVIMFMPGEYMLQIALYFRPELWEEAVGKKIILASPYILLALLKSVFFSWKEEEQEKNSQKILLQTSEIVDRIGTMMTNFEDVGKGLTKSVKSYNKTIGSYNRRLLPARERLDRLRGSEDELLELDGVEEETRKLK